MTFLSQANEKFPTGARRYTFEYFYNFIASPKFNDFRKITMEN